MSLPYFIADDPASGVLDGPEGRHAVSVKRITPGEHIMLVDGSGTAAELIVRETRGKDSLVGDVVCVDHVEQPTPRITVVQAIPKSERAELAVDLAVQGGAEAIVPWISQRTIARWPREKWDKQVAKWQATAREAAKQSRRSWVPTVSTPVSSEELRAMAATTQALILHEDAQTALREVTFEQELLLIVGPEGGIGTDEVELIGAQAVKLGPEVLRTASAGFAALSAIGALSGRW